MVMNIFQAGKGINATKINDNFSQLQTQTNTNETNINTIAGTALLKNGTNLTQSIVDAFNKDTPNITSASGTIVLDDGTTNFLTLTGNGTISLPSVESDSFSHTIVLIVQGGQYSLDLGTTKPLGTLARINPDMPYQVLYIFNKIDNSWYYCLGQ